MEDVKASRKLRWLQFDENGQAGISKEVLGEGSFHVFVFPLESGPVLLIVTCLSYIVNSLYFVGFFPFTQWTCLGFFHSEENSPSLTSCHSSDGTLCSPFIWGGKELANGCPLSCLLGPLSPGSGIHSQPLFSAIVWWPQCQVQWIPLSSLPWVVSAESDILAILPS